MRRAIAIIVGFITTAVLAIGADGVLRYVSPSSFSASGATHSLTVLWIALLYSTAFAVLGGYVAGRLAPSRPVFHACFWESSRWCFRQRRLSPVATRLLPGITLSLSCSCCLRLGAAGCWYNLAQLWHRADRRNKLCRQPPARREHSACLWIANSIAALIDSIVPPIGGYCFTFAPNVK